MVLKAHPPKNERPRSQFNVRTISFDITRQIEASMLSSFANKLQMVIDAITVIHYGINIISMKYMG